LYKPLITDYRTGGKIDRELKVLRAKPAPVSFCAHKSHIDCLRIELSLPK
jgi:hypothetical protein